MTLIRQYFVGVYGFWLIFVSALIYPEVADIAMSSDKNCSGNCVFLVAPTHSFQSNSIFMQGNRSLLDILERQIAISYEVRNLIWNLCCFRKKKWSFGDLAEPAKAPYSLDRIRAANLRW